MWKERPFTHLRPSTIAETLDRALVVTIRFAPLLFLASLVGTSNYLFSLAANHWKDLDRSDGIIAGSMLFLMLLGDFVGAVGFLAVFQGLLFPLRPTAPTALMRTALRKLPGFFFTQIFYMLAVVFFASLGWKYLNSRAADGQRIINAMIGVGSLLLALWLVVRLSLAPIVSLIEETSPFRACQRSINLTSPSRAGGKSREFPVVRWLLLSILPASIIVAVCLLSISYALTFMHLQFPLDMKNSGIVNLRNATAFAASFLAAPFYRSALMALYIEYRMRHEGLDFYLRLREMRRSPASAPLNSM